VHPNEGWTFIGIVGNAYSNLIIRMEPLQVLKQYWGHDAFRPLQEEIIQSVIQGKDTLALLPTGGGKSICFQIPGLVLGGITLVISPLIALMKDQVENLNRKGIPAAMVSSVQSTQDQQTILQACVSGRIRFLYCSPERLKSEAFYTWLRKMKVGLLALDEAHCVSQWGYDFRPAYLEIAAIRELLPGVPCIALTASATPEVVEDIALRARLKNAAIFKGSFHRKNLRYFVLQDTDREEKMLEIIHKLGGSGIVYARSRKGTVSLAEYLNQAGIQAEAYHAGLSPQLRNQIQQDWIDNRIQAIAATNAFGMGIDKPDVRWVIHLSPPPDMESYYQEAGRAGRDGNLAFAVLITNPGIHQKLVKQSFNAFPSWEQVHIVSSHIWGQSLAAGTRVLQFDAQAVSSVSKVSTQLIQKVLGILEREDFIKIQEPDPENGQIRFRVSPEEFRNAMDLRPDGDLFELMLRELGGAAFREFMDVDLRKWAQKRKLKIEQLIEGLKVLNKVGYIDFTWSGELPILYMQTDTPPQSPDMIHWKAHLNLQAKSVERLNFMVEYAESMRDCRPVMICGYFGEMGVKPCGICDVCSGRHSQEVKTEVLTKLSKELKLLVKEEGMEIAKLTYEIRSIHPGIRIKALRMLAEFGKIKIQGDRVFLVG